MKTLVIVHPRHRHHKRWLNLRDLLEREGLELDIHHSEWAGHSKVLACDLVPQRGSVLVVGGDGTWHEVVNGWMSQTERGEPRFVLLPMGTGNDFARALGLCRETESLLQSVVEPATRRVDVVRLRFPAEAREVYFVSSATLGFSAEVVRYFQSLPRLLPGTAQYLFSMLVSLLRWRNTAATIYLDETTIWERPALFNLNLANTRYYGGGMVASPLARADSGELQCVAMSLGLWGVLKALPRNYSGDFEGVEGVSQASAQSVRVESGVPIPVQADGEFLGTTPIEVELLPGVLPLGNILRETRR